MSEAAVAVGTQVKQNPAVAISVPILRILTIHPNNLTDFLYTLPALRALRESFPGAKISAFAPEMWRECLEESPDVDVVVKRARQGIISWETLCLSLREQHFDLAVCFCPSRKSTLLALGSGAQLRAGFADARWSMFLTHPVSRQDVGAAQMYLQLVRSLGCRVTQTSCRGLLTVPQPLFSEIDVMLEKADIKSTFAVIATDKNAFKNLSQGQWPQTVEQIAAKMPVVLLGSGSCADFIAALPAGAAVNDFSGRVNGGLLAALLARAQVLVGSNNGLWHLAVCMQTPVVGTGGSQSLRPCGMPFRLLSDWTPEQMLQAVETVILESKRAE